MASTQIIQTHPSLVHDSFGRLQRLKKIAETVPIFLITLPLFLIINIEKRYHHFIAYQFVYKEILWLFAVPFLILLLSFLLTKTFRRACIFSFILCVIFYFFCDLKDYLIKITNGAFISSYIFLLPLIFLITVLVLFLLKKTNKSFRGLFLYTNVSLILFIILDIFGILFNTSVVKNDMGDRQKTILSQYKPCHDCPKPDIYYIIFDEYTSSEILREEFHYVNGIDSFLSEKKFRIIPHSKSNYNLTPFSIASCFNLNYLQHIDVHKDFYMKDYLPGLPTIYKSELIPILQKEGYSILNHSIFNIENHQPETRPFDLWKLHTLYGRHNIFKKIDYDIGWWLRTRLSLNLTSNTYRSNRDKHFKESFQKFLNTVREHPSTPQFVYAHFMLPHGPNSFDSTGEQIPFLEKPPSDARERKAYVQQVIFTNKIMKQIVEEIFLNQRSPLIIIIQGDHGYKYHNAAKKYLEFGNLNAIYFSNHDYHLITDSTSNVNTFRIVLNNFFKKNFKILNDTSYFLNYK